MSADCIEWPMARNRAGYGVKGRDGSMKLAHRLAWIDQVGPIPEGLCVLHRCDNRACVNVDHLFLGTQLENIRDMHAKGRGRDNRGRPFDRNACWRSHVYDEANTYWDPLGKRHCRKCSSIRSLQSRLRKKGIAS